MAKTKAELQEEAKSLGIEVSKDGKDLTVDELNAAIKEKTGDQGAKDQTTGKKKTKVRFLKSPSGKFLLPYNVGQEVKIDPEQAKELIENGFAEKV